VFYELRPKFLTASTILEN